MPSLITCPGCTHKLMLPDESVGQRVKCPRCSVEFAAEAGPIPAMEVDAAAAEPASIPTALPAPPLETGYAPANRTVNRPVAAPEDEEVDRRPVFCIACGTKFAQVEGACPNCGHSIHDPLDGEPRRDRRPLWRTIEPVRDFLPIATAILVPVGVIVFCFGPIVSDGFRRPGSGPFVIGVFCLMAAGVIELLALAFGLTWLYQAWRAVVHGDEEYTPGLMVGMLFVPFFNLYWMFRAIPGLSLAIQEEMRYLAPHRKNTAGWIPGLAGCIIVLIPGPLWAIAVCMLVAWMLLANNAVQRLIRIHNQLRAEAERRKAASNGPVDP